jgi:hypothetical protein
MDLRMRHVATAEEVRKKIVEHGASIRDRVIENLPHNYALLVEQVRSISRTYKTDFDTFVASLSNVRGLDLLITYTALVALLSKHKPLSDAELKNLAAAYEKHIYDVFSASRIRRALEEVGVEKDVANQVITDVLRASSVINNKYKSLYLWIAKQRKIADFENGIREVVFRGEGGNRVGRGVKLFLRLFIHETNIPLATKIAYGQEHKKYILHGDMYTALVTLRSGAFEDVPTLTAERVKARVAKRLLCEAKEGKCRDVLLRLESIRGLVRHVGKISGDPVLFERGAYDIGSKYCKDLRCEECPLKDICRRHTFIKVK